MLQTQDLSAMHNLIESVNSIKDQVVKSRDRDVEFFDIFILFFD